MLALAASEIALRLFKPQIFEMHPKGMYVEDDEVGYVLAPNFSGRHRRTEFDVAVNTDRAGRRRTGVEPPDETAFRVLVLGDSQAFGFGVEDSETFASQLEELLNGGSDCGSIEVLNAGVPGYGTFDQLNYLRSRGAEVRPDLVLVQFLSANDLLENRYPAVEWARIEGGYLSGGVDVVEDAEPVPRWLRIQYWLKNHSHLARLSLDTLGYLVIRAGIGGRIDAMWGEDFSPDDAELGTDLLEAVAAERAELEADMLLLYTTGQAQVLDEEYRALPSRRVIEDFASESGTPWVDITSRLRTIEDRASIYFPKNGHWTPAGHRAVAEILVTELTERDLVPSGSLSGCD